jgi:hypothetical protein
MSRRNAHINLQFSLGGLHHVQLSCAAVLELLETDIPNAAFKDVRRQQSELCILAAVFGTLQYAVQPRLISQ